MKRNMLIAVLIIIILIILSFFIYKYSNKLTCTYNENYEDIKIENKIVFNFKEEIYEQIDKMIFQDEESAKKYLEDISEFIDEYNLELVGNVIVSKIEDTIKLEGTKKEIKEKYESYNYTCK